MFTEQPPYSTTLYRRPSREQFFQIDVENEWDFIAEAVVASDTQPSIPMDQLAALLESHGIVVHRLPASLSESVVAAYSPFVAAPLNDQNRTSNPSANGERNTLFLRDAVLVHGSRVVEAPPLSHVKSSRAEHSCADALFSRLEKAGAEVLRWPSYSSFQGREDKIPEGKLVEVEGRQEGGDKDEEGPLFCPSDILILSPTLLITRLSPFTNNKGLEYLWSVLSTSPKDNNLAGNNGEDTGALGSMPRNNNPKPAHTTTLLVRITEPDAPTTSPAFAMSSPRTSTFAADVSKPTAGEYVPLCRALVPINGNVMLYDPILVAEDEARRLKSVLDRVQEGSRLGSAAEGGTETGASFAREHSKNDSVLSYGTFRSLNRSGGDGWNFVSVDGLHSTSILLISPRLALLNTHSPTDHTASKPLQEDLTKVSQALESLGVRAVTFPSMDFNHPQPRGGVRDAVLVLRRESNVEASDDWNNRGDQQLDEESPAEGCMGIICASLSAWICESLTNSGEPEAETSDHL